MARKNCIVCKNPVASPWGKYCAVHRGEHRRGGSRYKHTPALHSLVLRSMLSEGEARYITRMLEALTVDEKPLGEQAGYVHLLLLAVQVRREARKVFAGSGDVTLLNRLIGSHSQLSDRLGLFPQSKRPLSAAGDGDPFGLNDFVGGDST